MSASELLELLAQFERNEKWKQKAQCRVEGIPVSDYFPARGPYHARTKNACDRCVVSVECRAFAAKTKSTYGMWGGEVMVRDASSNPADNYERTDLGHPNPAANDRLADAGFVVSAPIEPTTVEISERSSKTGARRYVPMPSSPLVAASDSKEGPHYGTAVAKRLKFAGIRVSSQVES